MVSYAKGKYLARQRRRKRVRKKIRGLKDKLRLSVYKSNRYIYAQLINDEEHRTLACVSSLKDIPGSRYCAKNLQIARKLGEELGKRAKIKGIKEIVFDRSGYPYHGRIKALAEAMRSQGIKF
ncbi:MAG: 50S ribosomal protein L18 [bacterium]